MGFVYLLNLLAWPLVTLVYPLYASIRAIETNSHTDNRKWLSYWILCGLIMLLEHTSARLIEWLPFWPYIKLMVTVWLVVPHFDGAVYAYDHLVRPCFYVDPQTVGYWLRPKKDEFKIANSDDFLLLAERFVQEKGSEALEKLIFGKVKCVEPTPTEENSLVASTTNKEAGALKGIKLVESSLAQTDHKAVVVTENKATAVVEVIGKDSDLPQSSGSNKAQKEWTCALCQVCTPSEIVLHNHVQGKKHKAKEKELVDSTLARTEYKAVDATEKKPTAGAEVAGRGCERPGSSSSDKSQKKWTCALCQVYTTCEFAFQCHLQGKKHKAKEKELVAKQMAAENNNPSCSNSKNTELPIVTPMKPIFASVPNCVYVIKPEDKRAGSTGTAPSSKNPDNPMVTPVEHVSASVRNGKYVKKPKERRVGGTSTASNSKGPEKPMVTLMEHGSAYVLGKYVKKPEENRVIGIGNGDQSVRNDQNKTEILTPLSALWCDKCKLQCNSSSMLTDHLRGKWHLAC